MYNVHGPLITDTHYWAHWPILKTRQWIAVHQKQVSYLILFTASLEIHLLYITVNKTVAYGYNYEWISIFGH